MKKYLIALDLDGTLLDSNQQISKYTENLIKKILSLGHKVVLASGRPLKSIQEYYDQLDLNTPIIAYNGGCVYAMDTSFPSYELTYDLKDVLYVYNKLGVNNVKNVMCETSTHVYLLKDDKTFDKWFVRRGLTIVTGDLNNTLNVNPLSMIFYLPDENISLLCQIVDNLKNETKVRRWSGGNFAEVYYPKYNKVYAIKKVADFYKISYDNVITIGDAGNDIDMIKEFKHGTAMKNATEEILSLAHNVTKEDNDHNGVAIYLKEILNL